MAISPTVDKALADLARDLRAGKYQHVVQDDGDTQTIYGRFFIVKTGRVLRRMAGVFFSMNWIAHRLPGSYPDCGSVRCIQGLLAFRGLNTDVLEDKRWFRALCYPQGRGIGNYDKITPLQAARAIANVRRTGRPMWRKVLGLR